MCVVCGCVGPFMLFVVGVGWGFGGGVWEGHAQCLTTSMSNILMLSVRVNILFEGEKKTTINCMFLFLFVVLILKAILSVCVCVCIFSLFLL